MTEGLPSAVPSQPSVLSSSVVAGRPSNVDTHCPRFQQVINTSPYSDISDDNLVSLSPSVAFGDQSYRDNINGD